MRPHRWQPTRLPDPWGSPGKNTEVGCHFLLQCMKVKSESEVTQSCPTLSDPVDCSLPDSSAHGIFQARVLEWGAIAFSKYYFKNTSKQNRPQIWLSGSVATAISLYRVHKESVRCETWTIKGTKGPRIDAFELWCWRRLFRAPWTEWRSNQLILKETNPEYSLEELLLKLKLRYFGHLMWRANTLEKTLMLRKS